jgi:gliding motility-associated-like protein
LYSNTYRLTATDANGCTGTDFIKIKVEKPRGIFVPSGFSPNGDGQNDLLVVHGEGRQVREIIRFRVYDRWGELVWEDKNFQVNDLTRGWDGTLRGGACDPGLFIWVLEALYLDGYRAEHQGEVLLIR